MPSLLEATVEKMKIQFFSSDDHRNHGGVLSDGVGDVFNLWHHRETMQGRPGLCYGGRSETMECS